MSGRRATDLVRSSEPFKEWFETPTFRGCAFINASVELADPAHPGLSTPANIKNGSTHSSPNSSRIRWEKWRRNWPQPWQSSSRVPLSPP